MRLPAEETLILTSTGGPTGANPSTGPLPTTLGRYQILGEIGRGAMGVVYKARDPMINREVALKAIPLAEEFEGRALEEARGKFFREAEMAGRLSHPHIVTIFDAGEDDGTAYIAMELLRGRHLVEYTDPRRLLRASVTLEALPGRVFAGEVIEIGASALPRSGAAAAAREFRVVVRITSPDAGLRPGLTCDAEIVTAEKKAVLAVPLQAVVLRPDEGGADRAGVFAVDRDLVRFVPVATGIIGGLDIEVSGVEAGRRVVVGPFQALRELQDGARIQQSR